MDGFRVKVTLLVFLLFYQTFQLLRSLLTCIATLDRVSCMVAGHEDTDVAAVVCLGYPLKVPLCYTLFENLHVLLRISLEMSSHKKCNCSVCSTGS